MRFVVAKPFWIFPNGFNALLSRLRANLGAKTADVDAAIETYNATVIDAMRDAVDQIDA